MNAFGDVDARAFEFNNAQCNAVDIKDDIRTFFILARDRDFLGNGKVIGLNIVPINQPNGFLMIASAFFFFNAIAQ